MTSTSQTLVQEPLPSVDPDGIDFQSTSHADHHANLFSVAVAMGFFSHGCDTDSVTSSRNDFRNALAGVGSF